MPQNAQAITVTVLKRCEDVRTDIMLKKKKQKKTTGEGNRVDCNLYERVQEKVLFVRSSRSGPTQVDKLV